MDFVQYDRPRQTRDIEIVIQQFADGSLKDGDEVKIRGAVHRIKDMGDFAFVIIRSPRRTFQCIWETEDAAQKLSPEDWVLVDGTIAADERSPLGFDIRISSVEKVGGPAEKLPLEISNDRKMKNLQLETLLDNRVVTLRNPRIRAIMRVADGVMYGFRQFLREEGFTEFVPPKMVMGGAEGGADMFMVKYFDQRAYLNQSPQQYKQAMVGVFEKVFTVGPVFRGENSNTPRHLTEFQGLDLEMGFIESFQDLMELETRMFQYIFRLLNTEYAAELDLVLGAGRRLPELDKVPQIKFADAKELYAQKSGKKITDPVDLAPEEEKWLGQYFLEEVGSPLVFVTHYPSVKRPFYAMDDPENPRYTLSYDLLLYGLEVTTGGQRIHDYDQQVAKMKKRHMNPADFENYLTMHKYGLPPHGGFGLGLERIVQKLLELDNIREASAFPRDRNRLVP
ncbi:MAG: aspartate--tRNA(Asn) ligase [Firmicutes bacterium]|nr:aspartate--tRNA(Asn) ligase [Bacillota bacterium]MDY5857070.1 aspartate--tRNA(Asn) ligase [Anaerovoracaceae bacterium]